MRKYNLVNALESCFFEVPVIVAIETIDDHYNVLNTDYYNGDNLPLRFEDYPVEYVDMIEQYDGSKVICFIAYETGVK